MPTLVYISDYQGGEALLPDDEFQHAIRVLRKGIGDMLTVVNGSGGAFYCELTEIGKKSARIKSLEAISLRDYEGPEITLACAVLKNSSRYEWMLEKAVEIGVDKIIPLHSKNCERSRLNMGRLHRIVVAACKQSEKSRFPQLHELMDWKDFLTLSEEVEPGQKLIFTCSGKTEAVERTYVSGNAVLLLIGPEGDFSDEEVKAVLDKGFFSVSLGRHRLRTETAAIAALQTIHVLNRS